MFNTLKNLSLSLTVLMVFLFSAQALAANCFLFRKDVYKTKPNGTKCWYQENRTGSTGTPPPGYRTLSSKHLKPGQSCPSAFMSYVKGQVTANSWSCVKGTLNGANMGTKGAP